MGWRDLASLTLKCGLLSLKMCLLSHWLGASEILAGQHNNRTTEIYSSLVKSVERLPGKAYVCDYPRSTRLGGAGCQVGNLSRYLPRDDTKQPCLLRQERNCTPKYPTLTAQLLSAHLHTVLVKTNRGKEEYAQPISLQGNKRVHDG
jgi:hypothetical protein